MICPLLAIANATLGDAYWATVEDGTCKKEKCAWWHGDNKECSIKSMAFLLDIIASK